MISYLQAITIGLLQGVTELFPVSSLGHSVLVPAWLGGSWNAMVTQSSTGNSDASPFLAFLVALHVATAIALLIFFWKDWLTIIRAFFRTLRPSLRQRRLVVRDSDERLAWLVVIATIPVGITGLALEHVFRTLFATPLPAAIFLTVNGVILFAGEWLRRRAPHDEDAGSGADGSGHEDADGAGEVAVATRPVRALATLHYGEALVIGLFQTFALLAGISRSGITMVGGLVRGLSHRDAARFAFLLATPVILAAGVLKLPTLAGPAGHGIGGQVLAGALAAGIASFVAVKWLTKWFETRTLTPFAIYCLLAGGISVVHFA